MGYKLITLIIILLLIWGGIFVWFKAYINASKNKASSYREWIQLTLADMFYRVSEQQIVRVLLLLAFLGFVFGFIVPGKISQMDKIQTIDAAVELNVQGKYNEALLTLDDLQSEPSPIVHNELGVAHTGNWNYEEAEKEFKRAIDLLPHYGKAHKNLATVYQILGRDTEAVFEESRAKESEKFPVNESDVYNISDDITEQLILRIIMALCFGFGAYNLPRLAIRFLKARRRKLFDDQLADGLVMISNGLRAGFSIVQAIEMVAKEAKPPLSQEFELVLREHRLGSSLGDAFQHMTQRVPSKDAKIMVNAALILLESGGNLPERFDSLARTIQERKRVMQKIKAMTAEGETQAWILALLPIVMGLILNVMQKEVFSLMYTTLLGWLLMAFIIIMEVVGIFWMLKVVKVKI